MIQHRHHIGRHQVVEYGRASRAAAAVTAAVDDNNAMSRGDQFGNLISPVAAMAEAAMQQHDRTAGAVARVPDPRAVVVDDGGGCPAGTAAGPRGRTIPARRRSSYPLAAQPVQLYREPGTERFSGSVSSSAPSSSFRRPGRRSTGQLRRRCYTLIVHSSLVHEGHQLSR